MNPYYFGTRERRLFGIYEAAARTFASRGVVLCHPWGNEYIHAYRAMRQLSKLLSAAGIHTLRFDYFGTGDSDGDVAAGDLGGWETDIQAAVKELKDTTGSKRVSLVGLRLGATLAANLAVRVGAEINSLVLWDPIVSGVEYLTEIRRSARAEWLRPRSALARLAPQRRAHLIGGFPLHEPIVATFRQIDLAALAPALPHRTLVVVSQPLDSHARFQRALDRRPSPLPFEHIDSPPGWIEWPVDHPLAGTLPVKVLQRIAEWLT